MPKHIRHVSDAGQTAKDVDNDRNHDDRCHDDVYRGAVAVRCVVECVGSATKAPPSSCAAVDDVTRTTPLPSKARTLSDTVVHLADGCPFVEIVPAALYRLGYGLEDCIGSTG